VLTLKKVAKPEVEQVKVTKSAARVELKPSPIAKRSSKVAILPLTLPDKVHSSPKPTGMVKSPSKKKLE
jgi:hypothetical protein